MPDDRLAAATAELYGAAPEAFTERRGELAAAARDAGDRAAAKAITALRRPTRSAWVVNQLARADPGAAPQLGELAAALRAAQEARQGPRLRELSAARGALVDALTERALAVAGVAEPPPSLRFEVAQTLTAALADPAVAAAFAAGTLTRAVQWSGFGVLPAGTEPGPDERPRVAPWDASGAGDGRRRPAAAETAGAGRPPAMGSDERPHPGARGRRSEDAPASQAAAASGTTRSTRAARTDPAAAARRQAEAGERLAREAAERAARRREQYEEAERVVVAAFAAAAAATSAEDRLEAEVRDLEQRLTRARTDLAAARMGARRAEAAERRARQALSQLSGD